jgi:Asp-tRNA(Asn)/Glu-tRNA(Gln) amidotransferase A subunit family amidase
VVEAWQSDAALVEEDPGGIGDDVRGRLQLGSSFDDSTVRAAWLVQRKWKATLERVFTEVDVLVSPTLTVFPPRLEDGDDLLVSRCTLPVNLGGVPALSLPVPASGPVPASIQLIGPAHSEKRLLAAGAQLEAAVAGG